MKKFFKNRMFVSVFLSASIAFIFVFVAVQAATTISTSITTGGNLTVSGTAAVTQATTLSSTLAVTGLTVISGQFQASSTSLFGGDMDIFGTASSTNLTVQTAASTTSLRIGGGSSVARLLFGTCTVNFPNTAASSTSVANCTATGVTTDFKVFVTPCSTSTFMIFSSASTTAANTIQVAMFNATTTYPGGATGAINPDPSDCWAWMAIR